MGEHVEYLGVYDADGGVRGELAYLVGHLLGTAECALCDITHTWRRKPEWDGMVRRLGVPFVLRHRDEVTDAAASAVVEATGLPVVLGRDADGAWHPLLGRVDLERAEGRVAEFERLLLAARADQDSGSPSA
ncbi:hypothetical protein GCM10017608_30660 [Agromyces luteolus]|uniref:GTPase n=1 Tax=Agromyces luteolus TaxID=88373 RepID=A0A7C9LYF6_9MICO|nr:hypothetical protein [Agromyces luteolus]MUN07517.1 hypothetical protein [Agromyces luteolus]GLK29130.1 hypothetical protein GCM10017608_30660 [Agromyces luteolus]